MRRTRKCQEQPAEEMAAPEEKTGGGDKEVQPVEEIELEEQTDGEDTEMTGEGTRAGPLDKKKTIPLQRFQFLRTTFRRFRKCQVQPAEEMEEKTDGQDMKVQPAEERNMDGEDSEDQPTEEMMMEENTDGEDPETSGEGTAAGPLVKRNTTPLQRFDFLRKNFHRFRKCRVHPAVEIDTEDKKNGEDPELPPAEEVNTDGEDLDVQPEEEIDRDDEELGVSPEEKLPADEEELGMSPEEELHANDEELGVSTEEELHADDEDLELQPEVEIDTDDEELDMSPEEELRTVDKETDVQPAEVKKMEEKTDGEDTETSGEGTKAGTLAEEMNISVQRFGFLRTLCCCFLNCQDYVDWEMESMDETEFEYHERRSEGTEARPVEKEESQEDVFLKSILGLVYIKDQKKAEELIQEVLSIMETVYSGPLHFTCYVACMDAISHLRKFSPPFDPETKSRIETWIDFFTKKDGPWYKCNTELALLAVDGFKKLFSALR